MSSTAPIGIFDSGIGGLTVARELERALPNETLIYFGDNANLPYGEKSAETVFEFSHAIVKFLFAQHCKMIVIACNTASAAALKRLRELYPDFVFVGMEPAVKPAAEQTQTGVVGVIATTATFQGELFASVLERYAQNVTVLRQPCPGLVQQIEAGKLDSPDTEKMLRQWIDPMLEKNIDRLVLGCTHYPFVKPLLEKICGPGVQVIDPAPAVARHTKRILEQNNQLAPADQKGSIVYYTSGSAEQFRSTMKNLGVVPGDVREAVWENDVVRA